MISTIISSIILFAAICNLILGIVVLLKDPRKNLNILFAVFAFTVVILNISDFLLGLLRTPLIFKSTYAIGIMMAASGFAWIYSLCKGTNWYRVIIIYLIGLNFSIATYIDNFFFDKIISVNDLGYEGTLGFMFPLLVIYGLFILFYAAFLLINSYRESSGIIKSKLGIITFGLIGFGTVSVLVSFVLPMFGISGLERLDSPSSLIFVGSSAYAMIKPRLSHK